MVTEEDPRSRWDEVHPILQCFRRRCSFWVEAEDFLGDPTSVGVVSDDVSNESNDDNEQGVHSSYTFFLKGTSGNPISAANGRFANRLRHKNLTYLSDMPAFLAPCRLDKSSRSRDESDFRRCPMV